MDDEKSPSQQEKRWTSRACSLSFLELQGKLKSCWRHHWGNEDELLTRQNPTSNLARLLMKLLMNFRRIISDTTMHELKIWRRIRGTTSWDSTTRDNKDSRLL